MNDFTKRVVNAFCYVGVPENVGNFITKAGFKGNLLDTEDVKFSLSDEDQIVCEVEGCNDILKTGLTAEWLNGIENI